MLMQRILSHTLTSVLPTYQFIDAGEFAKDTNFSPLSLYGDFVSEPKRSARHTLVGIASEDLIDSDSIFNLLNSMSTSYPSF